MTSTSILPPAVRRSPARRRRGSAVSAPAARRAVHLGQGGLGQGGLAQRRAQLEACWRDRLERVTALSLAYHDAAQEPPAGTPGDGTPGNGSAVPRRARQIGRQAVAERQALAEIEAALDRMTAGRYGWCEQCGQRIAADLLAVQPQARYCTACCRQPSDPST
jgi:DnaK suppressor protein